ncbi:MAG: glycosyltransferase family 4 protein, partial [Acidobacteriota bacterium]
RVPEDKIKVTYNCLDSRLRPIADVEQLESFRRRLNLTGRILLYTGAILNRRSIPEVIKALGQVVKKFPEATLVLVGENRTYPWIDLLALVDSLELGNKVRLLGYVNDEDLVMFYNIAEIFIYLSSYEGFGLPPLEALACGTPVIIQDIPAVREVLGDTVTMLPRAEVSLIAEAVMELLETERKREEMVRRAAQFIRKFSCTATARLTLEHLHKVLA